MPTHALRNAALILGLALTALVFGGCAEDDSATLKKAASLAKEFHDSMVTRDIDGVVRCVGYPFNFDARDTAKNEAEFRKILDERWNEMFRKIRSAVHTQEITYEAFLDGGEIRGQSYDDPDKARAQAEKIGFRENGVLVCCYHVDKETNQTDARAYFLVLQPDQLNDLKVVTYYD